MRKNLKIIGVSLFFLALASTPLLAQEATLTATKANLYKLSIIVGGAIITLASAAGAFCQAKAISSACEGISRNPASGPLIRIPLFLTLVLIETLVIYALFIAIFIIGIQWGNYP